MIAGYYVRDGVWITGCGNFVNRASRYGKHILIYPNFPLRLLFERSSILPYPLALSRTSADNTPSAIPQFPSVSTPFRITLVSVPASASNPAAHEYATPDHATEALCSLATTVSVRRRKHGMLRLQRVSLREGSS